jgi:AcrR family transcriptional regulator
MNDQSSDPAVSQIVEAARNYFTKFGYSRVSTGEIAKAVGRSKKTLYKHFETKEQLLLAVVQRLNGDAEKAVVELTTQRDQPLVSLRAILEHIAVHVISTQDVLFGDLAERSQELFIQASKERQQALAEVVRPLFLAGNEQGILRDDLDFDRVMTVFVIACEQLATPIDLASSDPETQARIETLVTLTVDGIRKPAS